MWDVPWKCAGGVSLGVLVPHSSLIWGLFDFLVCLCLAHLDVHSDFAVGFQPVHYGGLPELRHAHDFDYDQPQHLGADMVRQRMQLRV